MDPSQASCGAADMPSCSPRCSSAAAPAALGRSLAWHLPRSRLTKQQETLQIKYTGHRHRYRSKYGGRLQVQASSSGQPAAPLRLETSTRQQFDKPYRSDIPSRRKVAIYAILTAALLLACMSQGQPGPVFASLTISSSSLGKEGASAAYSALHYILYCPEAAPPFSLCCKVLNCPPRASQIVIQTLCHRFQSSDDECMGWARSRIPPHSVRSRPFGGTSSLPCSHC